MSQKAEMISLHYRQEEGDHVRGTNEKKIVKIPLSPPPPGETVMLPSLFVSDF